MDESGGEDERDHQRRLGDLLYYAARCAFAGGVTRDEFITLSGFFWGQVAADYGHAIVAQAIEAARGDVDE